MRKATVLIVETHLFFLRVLKELLAGESDIDVAAEAYSAQDAFDRVLELGPDVVVVDISLGASSGLAVSQEIKRLCPATSVIILAEEDGSAYRQAVRDSGANALVKKASASTELAACIRQAIEGGW